MKPETTSPRESTPSIQSLDRGLIILEAVAGSNDPVSLAELTDLMGIDRSSVFRLANTLKRRGYLACPSGRKDYILGPSIWRLSRQYNWGGMLVKISHEQLRQLTARTGETGHLAVREGRQALFIDHVTSNHVIAVSGQTGELVPLHCTAHGKALLADLDKTQLQTLFGSASLKARTSGTIVSLDSLAESCAGIRQRGFATDDGEYQEGIRCVAAPIRDRDGAIIGSIGVSAPTARMPLDRHVSVSEQVTQTARQISEALSSSQQKTPSARVALQAR
jgi:IclR family transcriptional regulator, acetate operon repressor